MESGSNVDGKFHSSYVRFANGGFFYLMCPVFAIVATTGGGGTAFGAVMAVLCLFGAILASRMGIKYSKEGVTVRGFPRTRKWTWTEIKSFSVAIHFVGAMRYRRKVLCVTMSDDSTIVLKDQNASPRNKTEPSWVDLAVAELNQHLSP
jgi:hypothetical protein